MLEHTQASTSPRCPQTAPVRVIAVSSGKGGVGKTNVAANLAVALGRESRNVMLLDADLSLANVDVLLGLQPRFNLGHVVSGETDLAGVIIDGPGGVRIVPAATGNFSMTDLGNLAHAEIVNAFDDLETQPDILIVDTAAGISDNVARYVQAAQEAIIVVCDEPSSITDAYALIKVFSRHYGITHFQIVTNQTKNDADGRRLFSKISRVSDRYLDVVLRHLGNVPHDDFLRRAVREQRAVVDAYPKSAAGQAFRAIARKLARLPARSSTHGGIQFFLQRLLDADRPHKGLDS